MRKQTSGRNADAGFLGTRSRKTIEKMADMVLEEIPVTISGSDLKVGKKAFFPLPLKMRSAEFTDFIYIYAESTLPNVPKDEAIGFTEDDVVEDTGIYRFKKVRERDCGETFPLEALISQINDPSVRERIICKVNEMRASIRLTEEFIELANTADGSFVASVH